MDIIGLTILIAVIVGILLIILSGLFYVKKDHVCVFEKLYSFHKVKGHGLYMMMPFFVRRVGNYSSLIERLKFPLKQYDVFLEYQIEDFKVYHYAGHNFKEVLSENLPLKSKEESESYIKETALIYGIKIQNIILKDKANPQSQI